MSGAPVKAAFRIATVSNAPGAVAVVQVEGDVAGALTRAGIAPVAVGGVALRDLCGVDRGVVAVWSETCASLMPHGGRGVVRMLAAELERRGIGRTKGIDARAAYPEAACEVEARMLATLARAASPAAIDLLLDQPRRWSEGRESSPDLDRVLGRLVTPPTVAAIGRANVGKSTLANALSGRAAAVVSDEPGTTRDHVGMMVNIGGPGGGVVVRYVDTPGLREDAGEAEREAVEVARGVVAAADLVLVLGDASSPPPEAPAGYAGPVVRVAARVDLGEPGFDADVRICAPRGEGVDELRAMVRERLVPRAAIQDPRAWRFWDEGREGSAT